MTGDNFGYTQTFDIHFRALIKAPNERFISRINKSYSIKVQYNHDLMMDNFKRRKIRYNRDIAGEQE